MYPDTCPYVFKLFSNFYSSETVFQISSATYYSRSFFPSLIYNPIQILFQPLFRQMTMDVYHGYPSCILGNNAGAGEIILFPNCLLIFSAVSGRKASISAATSRIISTGSFRALTRGSPSKVHGCRLSISWSAFEIFPQIIFRASSKQKESIFSVRSLCVIFESVISNVDPAFSASFATLATKFPRPFARSALYISLNLSLVKSLSSHGWILDNK